MLTNFSVMPKIVYPSITISKSRHYVTTMPIQYSDGVIQACRNINSEITDYVQKTGIPFLGYQDPENYIDAYNDFYNKIVGNE